jgi:hypothetical protein
MSTQHTPDRTWQQAIGTEISRQCSIGAGTCGTADDGSGLFEVNASLDLNGFAHAMALAVEPTPPTEAGLKEAIAAIISPDAARYIIGQEKHRHAALWAGSDAMQKAESILALLRASTGAA